MVGVEDEPAPIEDIAFYKNTGGYLYAGINIHSLLADNGGEIVDE